MNPPLPRRRTLSRPVSSSKGFITEFLEWFGDLGIFSWRVVRAAVTPPYEFRELFRQLDELGSKLGSLRCEDLLCFFKGRAPFHVIAR